jgi:hypothetical protein
MLSVGRAAHNEHRQNTRNPVAAASAMPRAIDNAKSDMEPPLGGLFSSGQSGQTGRETPAGILSIIQKEGEHYSNLCDDAYMPNMQRLNLAGHCAARAMAIRIFTLSRVTVLKS